MTDDDEALRKLARQLPWDRPDAARREAVRSQLLVDAGEGVPVRRARWPLAVAVGSALAAAAAVVIVASMSHDTHARGPAAPTTPITGTWKATPEKGIQIELTLRDDKTFTWKFSANGKTQNFSGKYQVSAKSLVLTREDGDAMDGALDRDGDGSFKFRMKDADADDPGLTFSR